MGLAKPAGAIDAIDALSIVVAVVPGVP